MDNGIFAAAGMMVLLLSICGISIPGTGGDATPTPPEWTPSPEITATPAQNVTPTPAPTGTPAPTRTPYLTPTPQPTPGPSKLALPNGDFETSTYDYWSVNDAAFGTAPSDLSIENSQGTYFMEPYTNYRGRYAASSFIPRHDAGAVGTLTSDHFVINKPYLEFLVTGMKNARLYVEINVDGEPVKTYIPDNPTTRFERVSLNLTQWVGKTGYIEIVDGTPNRPFGYIEVDDFYLIDYPTVEPS